MDEREYLAHLETGESEAIEHAWQGQIKHALLWHACCEAVATGDRARLAAWRQALDSAQRVIGRHPEFGTQHVKAARASLACADLALAAAAAPGGTPASIEALIALLHQAAELLALPCDCDRDHGALRHAVAARGLHGPPIGSGTQDTVAAALEPVQAVDLVFALVAGKPLRPAYPYPISCGWAWDVTRSLLQQPREVVWQCALTVAGTAGTQGFLPTLTLEVLSPGCGDVFHSPQDAFRTHADEAFIASMRDAWQGARQLLQVEAGELSARDGRWRLQHHPSATPVAVAQNRSASGAAARGWWHALQGKVPDRGLVVIAQVDPKDVLRLIGVADQGVLVKTQAIAEDIRGFDTIVVAHQDDAAAALQGLPDASPIRIVNLADS